MKSEGLRWLCIQMKRAQCLCEMAMCYNKAARLAAEKAPYPSILLLLDQAIKAGEENQLLFQVNFEDDYHWDEGGLAVQLVDLMKKAHADIEVLASKESATTKEVRKAFSGASEPFFIPWEKLTDIVPAQPRGHTPGLYLHVSLGLPVNRFYMPPDPDGIVTRNYFCHGVVYTIQARTDDQPWSTVFRRTLDKNSEGWETWDIPLDKIAHTGSGKIKVRLVTDSYSRASDLTAPTWQWALWGNPSLMRIDESNQRHEIIDLMKQLDSCKAFVKMDRDRQERAFDGKGTDSTGAIFHAAGPDDVDKAQPPDPKMPVIKAYTPHKDGKLGLTIGQFETEIGRF
jgi:hypothetical protein